MESRIFVILLIGLSAWTTAYPQKDQNSITQTADPTKAKIMKQINKVNDDGSYTFGYEADDGSFRVETRSKDGVVKGKYGFIDPNGELKVTEYTAGEKAQNPGPTQTSDQNTAAQTPSANKVSRPAPAAGPSSPKPVPAPEEKTNSQSYEEEDFDVDDGAKKSEITDDEDFRSIGQHAQQQYARRQAEIGPTVSPAGGRGQQFPGVQGPYSFQGQAPTGGPQFAGVNGGAGAGPRYVPSNGQFDYDGQFPGGFGGQQFSGQPQFGGQFGGPQQFSTPVLRSPQIQGFGGQPQFDSLGQQQQPQFGRGQSPTPTVGGITSAPQDFSSIGGGFDDSQQQLYNGQQFPGFAPGRGGAFGSATDGYTPGLPGGRQFAGAGAPLGGGRQFAGRPQGSVGADGQRYVPNYDLDGFSEDADQDGFVDPLPGQRGGVGTGSAFPVAKAQAAEKQGVIKTPGGSPVGGADDYRPSPLGPQGGLQGGRVQLGGPSPTPGSIPSGIPQSQFNDEQFNQIYSPQFQGGRPDFQGSPQFGGRPDFQGGSQQFAGGRPDFQGGRPDFQGGSPQFAGGRPDFQGLRPIDFSQAQQGNPQFQGGRPEFQGGNPQFQGEFPQFQQGGRPQFQGGSPFGQDDGQFQGGPQFLGQQPSPYAGQGQFGGQQNSAGQFPQGFQGGIPQQGFSGGFPGSQQQSLQGQGQQQFSPQFLGQSQNIPPQYLQGGGNPQFGGQGGLQSGGLPFEFSPFGGAGGFPGGVQGGFPGGPQGFQQGAGGGFPGGASPQGGSSSGGFPGSLSQQQLPQQFLTSQSGRPAQFGPQAKEAQSEENKS